MHRFVWTVSVWDSTKVRGAGPTTYRSSSFSTGFIQQSDLGVVRLFFLSLFLLFPFLSFFLFFNVTHMKLHLGSPSAHVQFAPIRTVQVDVQIGTPHHCPLEVALY